jgi:hypothetical protein
MNQPQGKNRRIVTYEMKAVKYQLCRIASCMAVLCLTQPFIYVRKDSWHRRLRILQSGHYCPSASGCDSPLRPICCPMVCEAEGLLLDKFHAIQAGAFFAVAMTANGTNPPCVIIPQSCP